MSIKIEQVNVKNLGPLNDFPVNFKQVNLFYGHNEHGKTYLVEFIYKSLFKLDNKIMSLRDSNASGKVIVSGLEQNESQFSPTIKKKLEDYWEESIPGLPRDFSKLLVVKGADLDFTSSSAAGIDDKIVKEFLSGEGLLESIGNKIKSTEATATYQNGRISGKDMGMVNDYNKARKQIQQIDDTIQYVNENISGGKRFELHQRIEVITKQKEVQERARQHLAFNLANQIANLKNQLDELPEELITSVDKNIEKYNQKRTDLENKQQLLEKNQELSKDYPWLEKAIDEYQKLILTGASLKPRTGIIWIVLLLISTILAVILVLIRQPYIGVGLIFLAVVFGFLYFQIIGKSQTIVVQQDEIEKIAEDYRSRFGDSAFIQGATLDAKKNELQPAYNRIGPLNDDIQSLSAELTNIEQSINQDLKKLPGIKSKNANWQNIINTLRVSWKELDTNIRQKENELFSLNIDKVDYVQEPEAELYDPQKLKVLQTDLETCKEELRQAEEDLSGLKQTVITLTHKDKTSTWEELVEALNGKRLEEVNNYKKITAGLLARINVTEVLEDLRKIEEKRIEEGLYSTTISLALLATTGHYNRIEKEGGNLYVSDDYGRYRVSDLSTGAREQVLLGLRIGFADRILAGTPLFLILDDAFQHSDYPRRKRMVEKLFNLSNEGWQIIYFTMDDHIRDLFESLGKKLGDKQYQTITLS